MQYAAAYPATAAVRVTRTPSFRVRKKTVRLSGLEKNSPYDVRDQLPSTRNASDRRMPTGRMNTSTAKTAAGRTRASASPLPSRTIPAGGGGPPPASGHWMTWLFQLSIQVSRLSRITSGGSMLSVSTSSAP